MPSFLNDYNSPSHSSQNSAIVHLDPASHYDGISGAKVNGQAPHTIGSHHSNDSFDASSQSTHNSDISEAAAQMNGNDTRTSTMSTSTFQNGGLGGETNGHSHPEHTKKAQPNGVAIRNSGDRTRPPQQHLMNGTRENDDYHRISMASTASDSMQPSPVGGIPIYQVNKGDVSTMSNTNGASLNGTPDVRTWSPSPQNSPSNSDNARHASSGQRFSAPTAQSTSGPGGLLPTHPGIKHRHTLEVPRPAPPRGSREGMDTAIASGRFSPTNAGTPNGGRRASLSLVRRNTRSLHSDMPRDEAYPDEDAIRWAEAYRQKRASKRKKKEEEDDDRVLVGTKVDEKHANWVTAYNMLTGIRVSVSRTNAKLDRPLTDADFEAKQKSTFDITGNELVPSAKYDFKFKDYAPWVFRHLRALFRLDPADYLMSLTGKYILSELGSPGKSGSFFYFSRDYRFIIKTIHHGEHKFLRKILKQYYQHVTDNPNTLLSQFYGLHRVKTPWGRKIHFVVMNNLFPPHRDIHTTFDLKGSTIGRNYKEEDLENNPRATLKDLNWLRRKRHLELGMEKKRLFMEQLQKDVKLMQKLHIMDYSLLIGVHDLSKGNDENLRAQNLHVFTISDGQQAQPDPHQHLMRTPSKLENQRRAATMRQMIKTERPKPLGESMGGMPDVLEEGARPSDSIFYNDDGGMRATHEDNTPGDEVYYLGVIDCLTHYGVIKKIEHFWKGLKSDKNQISALPPDQYGDRFLNFMTGITMSPEEAEREKTEKDQAAAAEAVAAASAEKERAPSQNNDQGRSSASANYPSAPSHLPPLPPLPPGRGSGARSPEVDETLQRAMHAANRTERHGSTEDRVPDRTIHTSGTAQAGILPSVAIGTAMSFGNSGHNGQGGDWEGRNSTTNQPSLPIVEEAGEASSMGGRSGSRVSHASRISSLTAESDGRPLTPAKDGDDTHPGFGNPVLTRVRSPTRPPPTPPKTVSGNGRRLLKPESADSGIGVTGISRARSGSQSSGKNGVKHSISRDSLEKALPPLPRF